MKTVKTFPKESPPEEKETKRSPIGGCRCHPLTMTFFWMSNDLFPPPVTSPEHLKLHHLQRAETQGDTQEGVGSQERWLKRGVADRLEGGRPELGGDTGARSVCGWPG